MPVVAGIVVAVVAIIAVALVSLDESSSEWPDEVAGLARVESAETRAFEEGFGEIEFGDLEIAFGFYGRADQVELMLARYANLPPGAPLEGLLQGAGGGIIGSGGSADIDAASVTERDGIAYHCMPFQGKLFVTDPSEADGQVCVWYEGADAILLMDATTDDLDTAVDHAASAHLALGG
jgi:hypothetical protein